MAKKLTADEVQAILVSGRFNQLLEAVEDEFLESKGAPYRIEEGDLERHELAKDISALANRSARLAEQGGHLLLGVQTRTSPEHYGDVIVGVSPFPQNLVNPTDYHKILESWLVARPEDIRIIWYPSATDPTRGIVGIAIPPQRPDLWPFLVRKVFDDVTGKTIKHLVGYYERRRDGVAAASADEIHRMMRDGRRYDSLTAQRLEGLSQQVAALQEAVRQQPARPEPPLGPSQAIQLYRQRRNEAITAAALNEFFVFALTAASVETVTLPRLFRQDDPLVSLLHHAPGLRAGGWTPHAGEPEIVKGQLRRAVTPGLAILECWNDATVIFAVEALRFLCWGMEKARGGPLRINPLALVESTYTFCELVRRILTHAEPLCETVEIGLMLHASSPKEQTWALSSGQLNSFAFQLALDLKHSPEASAEFAERCPIAQPPGVIAYRVVRLVYTWFGLSEDMIPYAGEEQGQPAISAAKIVSGGR